MWSNCLLSIIKLLRLHFLASRGSVEWEATIGMRTLNISMVVSQWEDLESDVKCVNRCFRNRDARWRLTKAQRKSSMSTLSIIADRIIICLILLLYRISIRIVDIDQQEAIRWTLPDRRVCLSDIICLCIVNCYLQNLAWVLETSTIMIRVTSALSSQSTKSLFSLVDDHQLDIPVRTASFLFDLSRPSSLGGLFSTGNV